MHSFYKICRAVVFAGYRDLLDIQYASLLFVYSKKTHTSWMLALIGQIDSDFLVILAIFSRYDKTFPVATTGKVGILGLS